MVILVVFTLGLIIGSFLNVVIARFETARFNGRSRCVHCHHQLVWFELFPVVSFLGLLGKCRYCHKPISWQYPLVELLTAGLFTLNWLTFGMGVPTLINFIIIGLLVVIVAYDFLHFLLPTNLVIGVGVMGLVYAYLNGYFMNSLVSGALWLLVFWLGWVVSRGRALGIGDANLIMALTFWVGGVASVTTFIIAVWSGAIIGVSLILLSRLFKHSKLVTMKSELPFAPFLVFGALVAIFYDFNLAAIFF